MKTQFTSLRASVAATWWPPNSYILKVAYIVWQSVFMALPGDFQFAVRYTKGEEKVCVMDRNPW